MQYAKGYQIYKPNAKGTGGAMDLGFSQSGLWLSVAKQIGTDRKFGWKGKLLMKLGVVDAGKLIDIIKKKYKAGPTGAGKEATIFHSTGNTNSKILSLVWAETEQYSGFYMAIFSKNGAVSAKAGVALTEIEANTLVVLLEYAIPKMLMWDQVACVEQEKKGDLEALPVIQQEVPAPKPAAKPASKPVKSAVKAALEMGATISGVELKDTGEEITIPDGEPEVIEASATKDEEDFLSSIPF